MKRKTLQILSIIILILSLIGINTIFKACISDNAMKCNDSVSMVKLLFLTSIFVRLLDIISKNKVIGYNIISTIISIETILIPSFIIGGCKMETMVCHQKAFPFIYIISILLLIIDIVQILKTIITKRVDL